MTIKVIEILTCTARHERIFYQSRGNRTVAVALTGSLTERIIDWESVR